MENSSYSVGNNRSNGNITVNFIPSSDDLADFAETQRFIGEFTRAITITYDINLAFGILFGLVNVILLTTVLDKTLRKCSRMWYCYHLVAMVTFTSLVLHTTAHAEWIFEEHNRNVCFFVMYSILYIFQYLGTNIVLINIEVFFTTVLPVASFGKSKFFRFTVVILSCWLLHCLIVSHLIINNNSGKNGHYNCIFLDESVTRNTDYVRTLFPGILCFLFTIAILGRFLLRLVRGSHFSSQDFSTDPDHALTDRHWIWCLLSMNALFILRVVLEMLLLFLEELSFGKLFNGRQLAAIVAIHVFRSQCLYLLPMPLLCLGTVRGAMKRNCFKVVELVSLRRIKLGNPPEDMKVRFTNEPSESDLS